MEKIKKEQKYTKITNSQYHTKDRSSNIDRNRQNSIKSNNIQYSQINESNEHFQQFNLKISPPQFTNNIHKRMKLKDYLHLKDIQKRGNTFHDTHVHGSKRIQNIHGEQYCNVGQIKEGQIRQQVHHNIQMIEEQLNIKIQQQINRLNKVQFYLKNRFEPKQKKQTTFVFLFSLLSKLKDIHQINQNIITITSIYDQNIQINKAYLDPRRESEAGKRREGSGQRGDSQAGQKRLISPAKIQKQNGNQDHKKYKQ